MPETTYKRGTPLDKRSAPYDPTRRLPVAFKNDVLRIGHAS